MPLMASALLGNELIASLELFRYISPHANVPYMNYDECAKSSHLMDENMQSWKQFGKMMITMRFVEVQILTKQQMAR
jgi:hypothetical protein